MRIYRLMFLLLAFSACTLPKKECPDPEAVNYREDANPASEDVCIYAPEAKFYAENLANGPVSVFRKLDNGTFESVGTLMTPDSDVNCDTPGILHVSTQSFEEVTFVLSDSISSDTFNLTFPEKGCLLINTDEY